MSTPLQVEVVAAAVIGPGLPDWATARPILSGGQPWPAASLDAPVALPVAARLPPAERRRVGAPVKLALGVAEQLFAQSPIQAADTATIFSSSSGDGETCHALSTALLEPEPVLSPTRFTNSVHNAVAGYWSIAVGAMAPSSALCAHDGSFCAGLLEAVVFAAVERQPVALIAFEVPYPAPIHGARPLPCPLAIALLLRPTGSPPAEGPAMARLILPSARGAGASETATRLDDAGLESLRTGVPAARGLPLLAALARGGSSRLVLDAGADRLLHVDIEAPV